MANYKIIIKTGDLKDAGTDADLTIAVNGTNNNVTWTDFDDVHDDDDLERGDINEYDKKGPGFWIFSKDFGDIKQLTVTYNAKKNDSWYLSSITVINTSTHKQWDFIANCWLTNKEPSVTLTPSKEPITTYYKVTIFTGDPKDGGTDARVYLNIFGSNGSYYLSDVNDPDDSDDFEAGDVNRLIIASSKDLGDLKQITIGHNNAKKGPGWYLDGVKIVNMRTNQEWSFPVYRWLSKSDDDGKTERTVPVGKDMIHYDYIGEYPPGDREPGWSNELNGICHDDYNWYITQDGNVWKFPVDHDLNKTVKKEDPSRGIYKRNYGSHLGDCDCYNGYLFVPVEGTKQKTIILHVANTVVKFPLPLTFVKDYHVAVFSTKDEPKFVARNNMIIPDGKNKGKSFANLGWLAINKKGLLFTSEFVNKDKPIYVYTIDFDKIRMGKNDFLKLYAKINLVDENGDYITRDHVQGGCFDENNNLYLCNGSSSGYSNSKGGITIFEIPDLSYNPDKVVLVKVKARSNQCHAFRFQFNTYGQEPEGLTYWDLDNRKAPGNEGQLHAIMIENNAASDFFNRGGDDLYFKHYRKI